MVAQRARCYYCYEQLDATYHLDHYVPLVLGGSNGIHNRVIACARCNAQKHDLGGDEFCAIMSATLHPNRRTAQAIMWAESKALKKRLSQLDSSGSGR